MTCKDCLHFEACKHLYGFLTGYRIEDEKKLTNSAEKCKPFKNKDDVAEIKHGKWISPTKINGKTVGVIHCSVCEYVPCDKGKYCPRCGAKMGHDVKEKEMN